MSKYIDAEKLIAEIERRIEEINIECQKSRGPQYSLYGKINGLEQSLNLVRSLQQEQPHCVAVPRWCLEGIEDTLRIQNNINLEKKTGETCQDRNVRCSLNQLRKLLGGEELTGMERLEPLKEQPEVDLVKEIDELWKSLNTGHEYVIVRSYQDFLGICLHCFELGLNARREE